MFTKLKTRRLIAAMLSRKDGTTPPTSGIYAIVNRVNGRVYIGSSVNMRTRIAQHKSALRNGKHSNRLLQEEWGEHGEASFAFGWIHRCESYKSHLRWMEVQLTYQILGPDCYCWGMFGQRSRYVGHPAIPGYGASKDPVGQGQPWA